jgi:hypothetical protein
VSLALLITYHKSSLQVACQAGTINRLCLRQKKAKKKAVKGSVWDEWDKDADQLFGEVYRGGHEGNTIFSIFHRLDLSYNKYSEGSWNGHYSDIGSHVLQYKTDVTGLENETFRRFVFGVAASQSHHRTPDSATVIAPDTTAARKRAREL